jgi:phage regulator Rha-like protein
MSNEMMKATSISMSSKEIAELTEKDHSHVLRDIRSMIADIYGPCEDPNLDLIDREGIIVTRDSKGFMYRVDLDKAHTTTLLTGYSAKARHRVIVRWIELESSVPALPTTYVEALEALLETTKAKIALESKVAEDAPKVMFYDQVTTSDSLYTFDEAFAVLQNRVGHKFSTSSFLMFCREHGVAKKVTYMGGIGKGTFAPRKDYINSWFVFDMQVGNGMWKMRPLAIDGIIKLIQSELTNGASKQMSLI